RHDVTVLERAELLKRRKEIYEAKYPRTRQGGAPGAGRGKKQPQKDELISSFAKATATKAGVSCRTVQHEVKIATDLGEAVKEQIRHMPLADNKVELLRLTRLSPEEQQAVAEKITSGQVHGVKHARRVLQAEAIAGEAPPFPGGRYRVIVIDPPWRYDNREADATHRSANPYPSM